MRQSITEEQTTQYEFNTDSMVIKSGGPIPSICSYDEWRPGIGYELPRTLGKTIQVPDSSYPSSGHLEYYEKNLPSTQSLVGQYDIIFHAYSYSSSSHHKNDEDNRRQMASCTNERAISTTRTTTARGTVSIQLSEQSSSSHHHRYDSNDSSSSSTTTSNELKSCLEGRVTYDQDVDQTLSLTDQLSNFSFVQKSEYQNYITMYTVGLAGSGGIVRCFTERVAVSLLGSTDYQVPRKLQSFKNVHEAEELNRRYYFHTGASWLCSHMALPSDIALMVRRFVCPPPVFFFEKGDLWIFYGLPGRTRLTTVARRRRTEQ
uniref:Uncharacterized protein n=1 Tax=Leptocylindrus danicus TaxID=163516 RepID=A0A7S2LFC1_9STRA